MANLMNLSIFALRMEVLLELLKESDYREPDDLKS
jgi:hypothetical protein